MNLHCNPANNHWPHAATGITISGKDVGNNAGRGVETGTLIFNVWICTGLTIKQICRYRRNIYIKTVWFVWSNVWCVNAVTQANALEAGEAQHSPFASYSHCHQVSSLSIASQCTLYRSLLCCGLGTADIFSCPKFQAASHNITTATASLEQVMSVNGPQLNMSSLVSN